jgi:phosphoadenosine phosphosulfate reductase
MKSANSQHIINLSNQLEKLSLEEGVKRVANEFQTEIVFSTSFSIEDQTITHAILSQRLPIAVFTLDTGRLFAETYSVWISTNDNYHTKIKAYYPNRELLELFVQQKGPNAFYESVENRKQCCHIRKVEPLKRALADNKVWITGLRAEHSAAREHLKIVEWDEGNQIIKYHPLLHWTTDEVKKYIRQHNIPYNVLHDKGFVSIGCAPCTRAIKQGEDFRAGRWWWEDNSKKECGLHEK